MSKEQLRSKIMKKYGCNKKEWMRYLLVDAMLTYYDEIHNSHTMLKGGLFHYLKNTIIEGAS